MSMPVIPKQPHRPDLCKVTIDLMESIALEEMALSHLVNAEAEKIQAFVGKHLNFPTCPNTGEIITFNKSVNRMIDSVLMKEFLLLRKLETTMEIIDLKHCHPHCDKCYDPCHDHKHHHDCGCAFEFGTDHKHKHEEECDCECDCHCEGDCDCGCHD
ncbi:hypothetical protein [Alkalihalophilus marmarensis]|uniref:hypothetical protein n=1 Tax=Alkalihalophilus marmarensis TaxID=521377 RepID=UPI002DBAFD04|nr:hypothetical protein [Alkalihalophilus marmarensis]MEC2073911.1 hypothetical protein [Alkalihalophilus marmarensis]